jgi:hypothetical protein
LKSVSLDGLPNRPKGTTRLRAEIAFASDTEATAKFNDAGFGEIEPAIDYEEVFSASLM